MSVPSLYFLLSSFFPSLQFANWSPLSTLPSPGSSGELREPRGDSPRSAGASPRSCQIFDSGQLRGTPGAQGGFAPECPGFAPEFSVTVRLPARALAAEGERANSGNDGASSVRRRRVCSVVYGWLRMHVVVGQRVGEWWVEMGWVVGLARPHPLGPNWKSGPRRAGWWVGSIPTTPM
jgi:hypothetical protein